MINTSLQGLLDAAIRWRKLRPGRNTVAHFRADAELGEAIDKYLEGTAPHGVGSHGGPDD